MSMKMASYGDAWLRENDQTHRPGLNSTFFLPCASIFNFKFNFDVGILKKCLLYHHPEIAPPGLPDHPGGSGDLFMA